LNISYRKILPNRIFAISGSRRTTHKAQAVSSSRRKLQAPSNPRGPSSLTRRTRTNSAPRQPQMNPFQSHGSSRPPNPVGSNFVSRGTLPPSSVSSSIKFRKHIIGHTQTHKWILFSLPHLFLSSATCSEFQIHTTDRMGVQVWHCEYTTSVASPSFPILKLLQFSSDLFFNSDS